MPFDKPLPGRLPDGTLLETMPGGFEVAVTRLVILEEIPADEAPGVKELANGGLVPVPEPETLALVRPVLGGTPDDKDAMFPLAEVALIDGLTLGLLDIDGEGPIGGVPLPVLVPEEPGDMDCPLIRLLDEPDDTEPPVDEVKIPDVPLAGPEDWDKMLLDEDTPVGLAVERVDKVEPPLGELTLIWLPLKVVET